MANHCCEVGCYDCGRMWCVRCFQGTGPSKEAIRIWKKHDKEWADRHNKGVISRTQSSSRCVCGSREVYFT